MKKLIIKTLVLLLSLNVCSIKPIFAEDGLKHPEWYPAKEVKIVNNDEVKKIEDKKGEE